MRLEPHTIFGQFRGLSLKLVVPFQKVLSTLLDTKAMKTKRTSQLSSQKLVVEKNSQTTTRPTATRFIQFYPLTKTYMAHIF